MNKSEMDDLNIKMDIATTILEAVDINIDENIKNGTYREDMLGNAVSAVIVQLVLRIIGGMTPKHRDQYLRDMRDLIVRGYDLFNRSSSANLQ